MLAINIVARLTGKKVYYIGCGVGDLEDLPVRLVQATARLANRVVVRDQRSARILNLKGVSVMPDLAVNYPFHEPRLHVLPDKKKPFTIIVSVMWAIRNSEKNFPELIKYIAQLINTLPPEGFRIVLLPMNISLGKKYQKLPDDLWCSQQLSSLIEKHTAEIYTERNIQLVVQLLRDSNLVIGTRLHANILATLNGTPCIGISYRPKVRSFFTDNGLDAYCLDLEELSHLSNLFRKLYADYENVSHLFYDVAKRNLNTRAAYAELIDKL